MVPITGHLWAALLTQPLGWAGHSCELPAYPFLSMGAFQALGSCSGLSLVHPQRILGLLAKTKKLFW